MTRRVPPTPRIGGIDALRFVAALAIVGFHGLPYPLGSHLTAAAVVQEVVFKWAIPFFFVTAGFFHRWGGDTPLLARLRRRMLTLGIPYVIWTTLRLIDLEPLTVKTILLQYVLCYPTNTLWFIWTLMLVALITFAWEAAGRSRGGLLVMAAVAAGLHVALTVGWEGLGPLGRLTHENPAYVYVSPSLWLLPYAVGLMAASERVREGLRRRWRAGAAAAAVFLAALGVWTWLNAGEEVAMLAYHFSWGLGGMLQVFAGIAVGWVALGLPVRGSGTLTALAGVSLGLYLVHPAVIRVFRMAGLYDGLGREDVGVWLLLWLAVAAASLAITVVLGRIRYLRAAVAA